MSKFSTNLSQIVIFLLTTRTMKKNGKNSLEKHMKLNHLLLNSLVLTTYRILKGRPFFYILLQFSKFATVFCQIYVFLKISKLWSFSIGKRITTQPFFNQFSKWKLILNQEGQGFKTYFMHYVKIFNQFITNCDFSLNYGSVTKKWNDKLTPIVRPGLDLTKVTGLCRLTNVRWNFCYRYLYVFAVFSFFLHVLKEKVSFFTEIKIWKWTGWQQNEQNDKL